MCWKWFLNLFHTDPVVYPESNKILLTQAINNYPGSANDLSECLNDQEKIINVLPDFQVRRFTDNQVCKNDFIKRHIEAFNDALPSGIVVAHYSGHGTQGGCSISVEPDGYREGFYLYDGVLWDYEFHKEVIDKIPVGIRVIFPIDSCFSEGAFKGRNNPRKVRFVQIEKKLYTKRVGAIMRDTDHDCVFMSACSEGEVAYDGAFSPCLASTVDRNINYLQWHDNIKYCINLHNFNQHPTIKGPDVILTKQIFT